MASIDIKITGDTKDIENALNSLNQTMSALAGRAESAGERIDDALGNKGKNGAKQFAHEMEGATQQASMMENAAKKLGAAMAGMFAVEKVREFASAVIDTRKEFQSLEVSFSTLLGSETKGKNMFKQITDFATSTPMLEKDLAKGAQTLLGFGIAEEKVMPLLKQLGDVAMGDSQKFQSLTLAFAQATSAGKLQGQDLLQMINAGFNPLGEMARTTGKSMSQLKDEMSKGKISAKDLADAFASATADGGKFNGMLEAQSKTLAGSMSNLEGAIQKFENAIGEKIEQPLVDATNAAYDMFNDMSQAIEDIDLSELADTLKTIGTAIEAAAVAWGSYKAAELACVAVTRVHAAVTSAMATQMATARLFGVTLTTTQAGLAAATEAASGAFKRLAATLALNPYALAIGAVIALTAYLVKCNMEHKSLNELTEESAKSSAKMQAQFSNEQTKLKGLFDKLKKAKNGTDEYNSAKKEIVDNYSQYDSTLSAEIDKVNDLKSVYDKLSQSIHDSFTARGLEKQLSSIDDEFIDRIGDLQSKAAERLQKMAKTGNISDDDVQSIMQEILDYQNTGKTTAVIEKMLKGGRYADFQQILTSGKILNDRRKEARKKAFLSFGMTEEEFNAQQSKTTPETKDPAKPTDVDNEAVRKQNAIAAAHQKELDQKAANEKAIEALTKKLMQQGEDAGLAALEEGWQKEKRAREIEHQRKLATIKQQTADIEEQLLKQARAQFEAEEDVREKNGGDKYVRTQWYQVEDKYKEQVKNSPAMKSAQATESKQTQAENTAYARQNKEALKDLLSQYQDYAAKRKAIEEKTNKDIEALDSQLLNATDEQAQAICAAIVEAKKRLQEELSKIDMDELFSKEDMAAFFNDMASLATGELEAKMQFLEKWMNAHKGDLDPSQLKTLADLIKQAKDIKFDRSTGMFGGSFFGSLNERKKRKQNKDIETPDQKRDFKISAANYAAGQAREAASMVDKLKEQGVFGNNPDSKVAEKVGAAFNSAASAGEAYAKFMQGDFLGAMNSALDSVISLFTVFGIGEGNMEELQKEIDHLTEATAQLQKAFDYLQQELDKSTSITAKGNAERAKENLLQQEQNTRKTMQDRLRQWESGSHSLGRKVNDDKKAKAAMREMGLSQVSDLTRLSPEKLRKMQTDYAGGAWTTLMESIKKNSNDHNGDADAFLDELDFLMQVNDKLDDVDNTFREKVTGISFDELKSSFRSVLADMSSDVDDFSADLEGKMNDIVLNKISDEAEKQLEALYKEMADLASDADGYTAQDRAYIDNKMRQIAQEALDKRNQAEQSGQISHTEQNKQGMTKGFESMTSEQADALNGRFTALQISSQGILNAITEGNGLLASASALLSASSATLNSLQMLAVSRNAWLEDIAKYCKGMAANVASITEYSKTTSEKL